MAALEGVSINKGNLKALLYVISHNNKPLRNHLETCAKNSTYISKRNLNALLECIKNYMKGRIIDKINQQEFRLVADEVADIQTGSNFVLFWNMLRMIDLLKNY